MFTNLDFILLIQYIENTMDMANLCKPSQYYLLFSIVGLLLMITYNILTGTKCGTVTNTFTFTTQLFYVLFWSWMLNKICQKGYSKFSWFLFLVPIVTSSVVLSILALSIVLGEDIYQLLKSEKIKEDTANDKRNVEPMTIVI